MNEIVNTFYNLYSLKSKQSKGLNGMGLRPTPAKGLVECPFSLNIECQMAPLLNSVSTKLWN